MRSYQITLKRHDEVSKDCCCIIYHLSRWMKDNDVEIIRDEVLALSVIYYSFSFNRFYLLLVVQFYSKNEEIQRLWLSSSLQSVFWSISSSVLRVLEAKEKRRGKERTWKSWTIELKNDKCRRINEEKLITLITYIRVFVHVVNGLWAAWAYISVTCNTCWKAFFAHSLLADLTIWAFKNLLMNFKSKLLRLRRNFEKWVKSTHLNCLLWSLWRKLLVVPSVNLVDIF